MAGLSQCLGYVNNSKINDPIDESGKRGLPDSTLD